MRYSDFNKAERTRRTIIEKAAPVFNKKGYAATTVADLTRVTRMTKGSIYGNFKNKDEVAACAFEHNVDFIVKNLLQRIRQATTYIGKLLAYPQTYQSIYKAVQANGGCPILNTSADADDLHPELHAAVVRRIGEWKAGIVHIIEKGQTAGEILPEIDAQQRAQVIIALIEGGFAMAKTTGESGFLFNALQEVACQIQAMAIQPSD